MSERDLAAELFDATAREDARDVRAARAAASIRRFGGYRWVGVYDVDEDEIAILGWDGPAPPAHPRFPRTDGLCGTAVATGDVVIVGDVAADPRYLTTHATTRSEIVVPILRRGVVVGVIDAESHLPDAFDERDSRLLGRCAAIITPLWG
jgi:L-methionine (R)-S-oxide reductase